MTGFFQCPFFVPFMNKARPSFINTSHSPSSRGLAASLLTAGLITLSQSVHAQPYVLNWNAIGWAANTAANGTDTNTTGGIGSAFYGLSSATGGVTGFSSQVFTNVGGSGVDVTIHYSQNGFDNFGNNQGPDLYGSAPGSVGDNPDRRVTGTDTVRMNSDMGGTITPTTMVFSFSQPVYVNQFIVGSLSYVEHNNTALGYEHGLVRAFGSANATGSVVNATQYTNLSALVGPLLGNASHPITNVSADNVRMDPNITDGVYHTIGVGAQKETNPGRYGRVQLAWEAQKVSSIAFSHWSTTQTEVVNGSTLPTFNGAPVANWTSVLASPITFSLVPEPSQVALGLGAAALALVVLRRRSRS